MFKLNWEKEQQRIKIYPETIGAMAAQAFPDQKLCAYQYLNDGRANINIKLVFQNDTYILRIYLRDPDAADREHHIANLMGGHIPIPKTLFIGSQTQNSHIYRFAITQLMVGVPLRDLLLNAPEKKWRMVLGDVGFLLSQCQKIPFSHAGFFDAYLNVQPHLPENTVQNFVQDLLNGDMLNNPQVQKIFPPSFISKLRTIFQTYAGLLPDESNSGESNAGGGQFCLVHGDFDPANILVCERDGKWQVTAILDWEFSFAGSWIWDVANMLRYAHHMPAAYQDAFVEGLKKGSLILPENWEATIALLNISALLDLLVRRQPVDDFPITVQDICELITHMVEKIENLAPKTLLR